MAEREPKHRSALCPKPALPELQPGLPPALLRYWYFWAWPVSALQGFPGGPLSWRGGRVSVQSPAKALSVEGFHAVGGEWYFISSPQVSNIRSTNKNQENQLNCFTLEMHRMQSSACEIGLGPSSQSPVIEALQIRS